MHASTMMNSSSEVMLATQSSMIAGSNFGFG